jgi:hypothetical protein
MLFFRTLMTRIAFGKSRMETDFIFKSAQISVSACGSALSAFYFKGTLFKYNFQIKIFNVILER